MERRDRSRSREREFKVEADLAREEGGEPEEDDRGRKLDRGAWPSQVVLSEYAENRPNSDDLQKLAQQEYQKQYAQYQQPRMVL